MKYKVGFEMSLDGCISKNDGSPITEEDVDVFMDKFFELCDDNGYGFGGGFGIVGPDSYRKMEGWSEQEIEAIIEDNILSLVKLNYDVSSWNE